MINQKFHGKYGIDIELTAWLKTTEIESLVEKLSAGKLRVDANFLADLNIKTLLDDREAFDAVILEVLPNSFIISSDEDAERFEVLTWQEIDSGRFEATVLNDFQEEQKWLVILRGPIFYTSGFEEYVFRRR